MLIIIAELEEKIDSTKLEADRWDVGRVVR